MRIVAALVIYARSVRLDMDDRVLGFLLQISPWLVMASGSRGARIALVVVLVWGLFLRDTRSTSLRVLPSAALALWIASTYQSLPSAIGYSVANLLDLLGRVGISSSGAYWGSLAADMALLNLEGRFFADMERVTLAKEAFAYFLNATHLNQWVGHGLGVAGFRTSGFPSPHQEPLDLLIETGIVGTVIYALFVVGVIAMLIRALRADNLEDSLLAKSLLVSAVCLGALSLGAEIGTSGTLLFLLALSMVNFSNFARRV